MSLYITDLTDDEPLPDYSLLKEAFIAAEAKASSNTITKTSEGLKVDIFKENLGIFSFGWHFSSAMFNKSAIEFMMLSLKHHLLILPLLPMFFKGIEREVISPRTRFIDPSQDFECTHPIVLNPHSSFL